MEQLILIVHVLIAVLIVALILIQHGKGADAGASFGSGASQTVFGVQGGGNLLTRWTAVMAAAFFATSLTLAYLAKQKSMTDEVLFDDLPALEQVVPLDDEIPEAPSAPQADSMSADEIPAAPAD